ncbi:uncharacterized protein UTRI_02809 [Ustilago trichophora]|uniref:BAR domain-containing protein n=1 Tax=Ustilago trichophora TaxID=86804 RepID=A0A5C3EP74_9BASI|nr:uncharacterized protein UTRI_02809 [Ustilago trichophora]
MSSLSTNKSMLPKRPQMNKIRSWSAGLSTKLSSSSGPSNDTPDLATEIEQRKKGIDSLYTSTEAYWSYLGKKKPVPFDTSSLPLDETASATSASVALKPERKMLPVEALGLAMSSFATAFPDGSAYGSCLGLLGEAHIKLANLQTAFTKDTSHIFLARIARSKATLDSFTAALKKLDTATARLESAQSKVQKSKKEKRELEEELRLAKAAYDQAVTDVEVRGEAIREAEYDDWQCLTTYMQAQLDYMGQAHAVLEQVKSMWGDAPPAVSRSGASTPLTRPRSLSGAKGRPSISRRSSAKDAADLSSSRFGSRSSLSLANSDRPSSASDEKDKESSTSSKKNRLRMPSFGGASDTVASVASGIGTFSRSRSSTLFGGGGASTSGDQSPEKDRESSSNSNSNSKWGLSFGSRKKEGFMTMDEAERSHLANSDRPPALPARDYVRPSVSALDVHLGDHDGSTNGHGGASPDLRLSRASSSSDDDEDHLFSHTDHAASPFSPDANNHNFSHRQTTAHETIHERGESQLSSDMHMMDSAFLGTSSTAAHLALNHTGLSAYSDGGDPFNNALSPHATGGRFDGESSEDEEEERIGLTAGSLVDSSGERRAQESAGGWKSVLNGNGSLRGPPPPIPSSASFLSKSKARLAPPPPPPLPSRNSS